METSKLIQQQQVAAATTPSKVTIGPRAKSSAPNIKLNKTGDVIDSIEIKCACGETIVVKCEFE